MNYSEFFEKATGNEPFPYQIEFATGAVLPSLVEAPTGAGKTATIILGWLWRLFGTETGKKSGAPRRLVYCLPMRVLVEQTEKNVGDWLGRLDLKDRVALRVLMGGEEKTDWDLLPEQPQILVGTQDMLLSRALNRGYGMSRYRWPMHFGLLNNDCLWVFDEVQLMGSGLATTAQLEAFRAKFGTLWPCESIWMSATLKEKWLGTVDFDYSQRTRGKLVLTDADKAGTLKKRLEAKKRLQRLRTPVSSHKATAEQIKHAHKRETLTLVVVNKVARAVALFEALQKLPWEERPELILLHSRFRPPDRAEKIEMLDKKHKQLPPGGRIVVSTQVIEAGVDISARTMFTDLAPWPSMVQRFGRCNREGEFAEAGVYWFHVLEDIETGDKKKKPASVQDKPLEGAPGAKKMEKPALPYSLEELQIAATHLGRLTDVSPASLDAYAKGLSQSEVAVLYPYDPLHVIRTKDMTDLFDTTPDLAGNDVDVSRFIREGDEFDVQVYWREFSKEGPSLNEPAPSRDELCSAPVGEFRDFVDRGKEAKRAYRWDFLREQWLSVRPAEVYPGQVYLVPSTDGGYDAEIGWNPKAKTAAGCLDLGASKPNDANDKDANSAQNSFQTIKDHSDMVVAELNHILDVLDPARNWPSSVRNPLMEAARRHDRGKAHGVFQKAVRESPQPGANDWAKAPKMRQYARRGFRHELASALAMLQEGLDDLACYLAAAHHGKVRLLLRSLPTEKPPQDQSKRFARGVWDDDVLPEVDLGGGVIAPQVVLSLEPMEMGLSTDGKPSWAERMLRLRDAPAIGPFRLAYLEALLRAADMRASAQPEAPVL